jgi:hypothetical protein
MRSLQLRVWMRLAVVAVVLVAPAGRRAAQQIPSGSPIQTGKGQQSQTGMPTLGEPDGATESAARMEQQRAKLLADDRQKHLEADTARLVQLSTELKDEVDKSGKFVTSVSAIRKAEEIEKLAHSVRDRMKN